MQVDSAFRTGLFSTVVYHDTEGVYTWERHLERPGGLRVVGGSERWCRDASTLAVRYCHPVVTDPTTLRWAVRGNTTLADALLPVAAGGLGPPDRTASLIDLFARLGAGSRSAPSGAEPDTPGRVGGLTPDMLSRLRTWCDGEWDVGASAQDRATLARLLGPRLFARLRSRIDHVTRAFGGGSDEARIHGALTAGNIVVDPSDLSRCDVLSGPDLTTGPRAYDAGVLLGELCEFACVALAVGTDDSLYPMLATAYLDASTIPFDDLLASVIVCRVAAHVVDYSSFVGPVPEMPLYHAILSEIVDDARSWMDVGRQG